MKVIFNRIVWIQTERIIPRECFLFNKYSSFAFWLDSVFTHDTPEIDGTFLSFSDQLNLIFLFCWVFVGGAAGPQTLTVLGRDITLQKTCGSIADCTFDELCGMVSICFASVILANTLTDIFPLWVLFSVMLKHQFYFLTPALCSSGKLLKLPPFSSLSSIHLTLFSSA